MVATANILWSELSRGPSPHPGSGQERSAPKEAGTGSRGGKPVRGTHQRRDRTGRLRVLVANAPLSYRQAMATAITVLRPDIEVLLGEPETLDLEVERFCPDVVVCSHVTATVEAMVPAWVDLYPEGDRRATISIDGRNVETGGVDLDGLLSIIDPRIKITQARG